MSWAIWETASTMPRRSMPPMLAFPLTAPSMLPKRRRISSYSKRIWASSCRACAKGRTTFANTLKYVFMATSANFGNMFSMAGASLFLPFLPLLPKQILLTNLLTDFPEMTIATDSVDPELSTVPGAGTSPSRKFMMTFGLVSSVFDYLTFGVLLWCSFMRHRINSEPAGFWSPLFQPR